MPDGIEKVAKRLRDKIAADTKLLEDMGDEVGGQKRDFDERFEGNLLDGALDRISRNKARLAAVADKVEPTPRKAGPHDPRGGTHSYFGDLYRVATFGRASSEGAAAAKRLERTAKDARSHRSHQAEVNERRLTKRGVLAINADGNRVSGRDVWQSRDGSTTDGDAGEFTPNVWLVDKWASIARSCAPLIATCDAVPLPDGTMEVFVPVFETFANTTTSNQDLENLPPTAGYGNPTTGSSSSAVQTVQTNFTVSQQVLDRVPGPGLDAILLAEAAEGYASYVESQLWYGDAVGAGGDYPGIVDNAGIFTQTYTSGSPTVTGLVENIAQCMAGVGNNRLRMPEAIFAAPARIAWLFGLPDTTTNAPTAKNGTGLIDDGPESTRCYGAVAGLPVYSSGVLNLGSVGAYEDFVFVGRPKDLLLLQSAPTFQFQNLGTVAGQISAQFIAHTYVASILRYPSGFGVVGGTGMFRGSGW